MLRARVQAELRLCAFVASYQEPKLLNQLTNLFNSGAYAKIWLNPIEVAKNYGFNVREVGYILGVTVEKKNYFEEKWNEFFGN